MAGGLDLPGQGRLPSRDRQALSAGDAAAVLGSGSHDPLAARRGHRARLRRRVRRLQPHPPERPDGQGLRAPPVPRARHVPRVAGTGRRRCRERRRVQLGGGLRGARVPSRPGWRWTSALSRPKAAAGSVRTTWRGTRCPGAGTSAVRSRRWTRRWTSRCRSGRRRHPLRGHPLRDAPSACLPAA